MAGSIKIQHGGTAATPGAGYSTLWTSSVDGEFYYTKSDGVTESLVGPQGAQGPQGIQGPTGIGLGLNAKAGSHSGSSGYYIVSGARRYDVVFEDPFNSANYTPAAVYTPSSGLETAGVGFFNIGSTGFTIEVPGSPGANSLLEWTAIAHGETTVSHYGNFLSTITQSNAGATAANTMTFNTTDLSNGVSVVSNSRITIANAGIYNIEFSAQLQKASGGDDYVDIWLSKNGNNVANTNTTVHLVSNPGYGVAAWNFLVQANAGDYYELKWHSSDTTMQLLAAAAGTNPTRPAIPSVILSVSQISS